MSPFGNIDLRVRDITIAQAFYEALLPALGFTESHAVRRCAALPRRPPAVGASPERKAKRARD